METDELEWYYLDRSGQEFGPFGSQRMAAWYSQGFFPIGDKLLVRTKDLSQHAPVHILWPDGAPFVGAPRDPTGCGGAAGGPLPADAPPQASALALPEHGFPRGHGAGAAGCGYGPAGGGWGPPAMGYGWGMPPGPGYPPMGPYGPSPMGYGHPPMGPYGYPPPMMALPPPPGPYGAGYGYGSRSDSRSRSPRDRGSRGGRRRGDGGRGFKPHHTSSVPKATDLAEKFTGNDGPPTTGMLRNIPNKYMQDLLLEEIDAAGFGGTYDFFYLPMDVRNNANVGYAFINFLQPPDFDRFRHQFEGYQFKRAGSKKIATVSPAIVQGLKANVQNLLKKRVAQGQYRPLVLRHGRRVELEHAADEL